MNYNFDKALGYFLALTYRREPMELCDPQLSQKASGTANKMVAVGGRALIIAATCNHNHALVLMGVVLLFCVYIQHIDKSCEQQFHIVRKV